MATQREDDFQQRVLAAAMVDDPELKYYSRIFQKEEPSSMETQEDGSVILFPESPEEFEEMIRQYGV